jgi:hypothetical protein
LEPLKVSIERKKNMITKVFHLEVRASGWGIRAEHSVLACCNDQQEVCGLQTDNGREIFKLVDMQLDEERQELLAVYHSAEWTMTDQLKMLENGRYEIVRSWSYQGQASKEAIFMLEVSALFQPGFYMIPCVSYNGNCWGSGDEPKELAKDGSPWIFAYDRSGIPSATISENNAYSVALLVSDRDEQSLRSACSLIQQENTMLHCLYWPEQEAPYSYVERDHYYPAVRKTVRLESGATFQTTSIVSAEHVQEPGTGWFKVYDWMTDRMSYKTKPLYAPLKVWELGIRYAKDNLFKIEDENVLFDMGLLPDGKHNVPASPELEWMSRKGGNYEVGWCGQNSSLALAMIEDYILFGHQDSLALGIQVLNTWQKYAKQDSGLFHVSFDELLNGNEAALLDVCNLGWGAWQFMNAYEKLGNIGIDMPAWLSMGTQLCDFFIDHLDEEDGFGRSWKLDGTKAAFGGTGGCFLLLPMLKAFELTRNPSYLENAKEAFAGYVRRDLDRMQCTAGALDTDCVDKETCWPLLKTALDLYELTGQPFYLQCAEKAGYYLLSWCYLYDVLYDEKSDFAVYGYNTIGATAVSVQHHHLDPWGALIAADWLRLYRHSGDTRWKARALATWNNSLLCLSDGQTVIHGMTRPAGSQNEAFFHCRWNYAADKDRGRGSMNDWLVAWPTAFRLITLMREPDWDMLE